MSDIAINESARSKRAHKKRSSLGPVRIDMTPMVDLAFLLLTFFILTSVFLQKAAMPLTMPVDGKPSPCKNILTLVLDKSDNIYYYEKMLDTISSTPFKITNYSRNGLRKLLSELNRDIILKVNVMEKKLVQDTALNENELKDRLKKERSAIMDTSGALTVVVKTSDDVKYAQVMDVLDELDICAISRKALVDVSEAEKELLGRQKYFK